MGRGSGSGAHLRDHGGNSGLNIARRDMGPCVFQTGACGVRCVLQCVSIRRAATDQGGIVFPSHLSSAELIRNGQIAVLKGCRCDIERAVCRDGIDPDDERNTDHHGKRQRQLSADRKAVDQLLRGSRGKHSVDDGYPPHDPVEKNRTDVKQAEGKKEYSHAGVDRHELFTHGIGHFQRRRNVDYPQQADSVTPTPCDQHAYDGLCHEQ